MNSLEHTVFSADYWTARDRFLTAARATNCAIESLAIDHPGPDGQALTMDIARLGSPQAQTLVVVSSGLHGIEGFFGSAVQLALLEHQLPALPRPTDQAFLLIHALNPYGFAYLRRWNEDNVDLNRNFLWPGELYQGSPEGYAQLNALLNPERPPERFNLFYLQAIAPILKAGFTQVRTTLATGQYDFPRGLFFGGQGPSQTYQLLATHLPQWVGEATRVLHLDFHTGLGPWGTYKLLTGATADSERFQRLQQWFGPAAVESSSSATTAYPIRGGLGDWCQQQFPYCQYELLTAEFGTYPGLRVAAALRAENQAHWWGNAEQQTRTRQHLKEMFVPASPKWRSQVLTQAIAIIHQACQSLSLD